MTPLARTALIGLLAGIALVVAMPLPGWVSSYEERPIVDLPLDTSLRVPFSSLLLALERRPVPAGWQADSLSWGSEPYRAPVSTRAELYRKLRAKPGASSLTLHGRSGSTEQSVTEFVKNVGVPSRLGEQWPLLLSGAFHVLVALLVVLGGRHPVVAPVACLSLSIGVALLCLVDQVVPGDPSSVVAPELRGRLGLLAWCLVPPSLLHLAMRFPVISDTFRSTGMVVANYALWACLVVVGQLRFGDAATLNGLEKLSLAIAVLAAVILVLTAGWRRRALSPIERSRAWAVTFGLVAGWIAPVFFASLGLTPSATASRGMALATLALPVCLTWSIVRYELIDPSLWGARHLRSAAVSLVAFLTGSALFAGAYRWLSGSADGPPAAYFAVGLVAIGVFQCCRVLVDAALRRWAPSPLTSHALVAGAIPSLAAARSASEAVDALRRLVASRLGAESVEIASFDNPGVSVKAANALWNNGLAHWQRISGSAGEPVVRVGRHEDPGPERPELLAAIRPVVGAAHLIVASGRVDGLPYSRSDVDVLERLVELAELALPATARAHELEDLVRARTNSLEQELRTRESVLRVAEALIEAESAEDVRLCLASFGKQMDVDVEWVNAESGSSGLGRAAGPGIALQGQDRKAELLMVEAFARLTLARIEIMSGLRREIRQKSSEIARVTARAYQAEFVRNLAHELRKPIEEVQALAMLLAKHADRVGSSGLRILGICSDLLRRLDTLLSLNGVRLNLQSFDLSSLVESALERARVIQRDREYRVESQFSPLPVVADPTRIRSAIENLIDNAVRATECGGSITVRSGIEFADGFETPTAYIEVVDDGRGVPEELGEDVFEAGISTFAGGFGLGLPLCRATARAHGGGVRYHSKSGVGARFRFWIPQMPPDDTER